MDSALARSTSREDLRHAGAERGLGGRTMWGSWLAAATQLGGAGLQRREAQDSLRSSTWSLNPPSVPKPSTGGMPNTPT